MTIWRDERIDDPYLHWTHLEYQGRPQSDSGLSAASTVNSPNSQLGDDLISPSSSIAVNGTECP